MQPSALLLSVWTWTRKLPRPSFADMYLTITASYAPTMVVASATICYFRLQDETLRSPDFT